MADKFDKPEKPTLTTGPKKPMRAANSRMEEAQRKAQAMAKSTPGGAGQFFQEAWVELKKTTWPTQPVLIKSTTVVLALVAAVAVWVGCLDAFLTAFTTSLHIFSTR